MEQNKVDVSRLVAGIGDIKINGTAVGSYYIAADKVCFFENITPADLPLIAEAIEKFNSPEDETKVDL